MEPRSGRSLPAFLPALLLALAPHVLFAQSQEQAWPESCFERSETIFDRVVRTDAGLRPVPAVDRHEPALGLEGRLVDVGEVRLWVEEAGEGLPLVLLSGGPGTSHHYFHPHVQPAASFARLIYVDPRGVGRSDPDPRGVYSVAAAVADLDSLRARLGHERWIVLGYSFGGTVAQAYALRHPERVRGLVLTSTAVPMDVDVGLGTRQREYMSRREVQRVAEIYSIAGEPVVPVHSRHVDPELQALMLFNGMINGDWKRRHLCRMSEDEIARYARYEFVHDRGYYHQLVTDGRSMDLSGRFRDSELPTLILEGGWDLAFGAWKPSVLAEQFPNAELVVLEDAGHTLFEDDPEGFFEALRAFVRELEAEASP